MPPSQRRSAARAVLCIVGLTVLGCSNDPRPANMADSGVDRALPDDLPTVIDVETARDTGRDTGSDTRTDTGSDRLLPVDAPPPIDTTVAIDVPEIDVPVDTGSDVPPDVPVDTGSDVPPDVPPEILAVSCGALHIANPSARSGVYRIDTDGAEPLAAVMAWCDMDTDGGGWTLVGRSHPSGNTLPRCTTTDGGAFFGWRRATGSVTDDTLAYSLDAAGVGLRFTQLLFGNYTTGKVWGTRLYRHSVTPDFLEVYRSSQLRVGTPRELSPAMCVPQGPFDMENPQGETGTMFHLVGFTDNTDTFHFRDIPGNGFGLSATGWLTCYRTESCYGGGLNRLPGMVMVR